MKNKRYRKPLLALTIAIAMVIALFGTICTVDASEIQEVEESVAAVPEEEVIEEQTAEQTEETGAEETSAEENADPVEEVRVNELQEDAPAVKDEEIQSFSAEGSEIELTQTIFNKANQNNALDKGSYYLSDDITRDSANVNCLIKGDVTIDLKGHTLDLNGGMILLYPGATLTINDSSSEKSGNIVTSKSGGYVVRTYTASSNAETTTFTLNAGTIESTSKLSGGFGFEANQKMIININGGKIIAKNGIEVKENTAKSDSRININDGAIEASENGILYNDSDVTINIFGGTISGGTYGLNVANNAGAIQLSGGTYHGDTYAINSSTMTLDTMLSVTADYESKYYLSAESQDPIDFTNKKNTTGYKDITVKQMPIEQDVHVCGGTRYENIVSTETTVFEGGKNYFLDSDIAAANNILVVGDVKLCLNGNSLNLDDYQFQLQEGASLEITDCKNGAGIIATGTAVDFKGNATFTWKKGSLTNTTNNPLITSSGDYKCIVNIVDGSLTTVGSVISIPEGKATTGSAITVSGGTITSSGADAISLQDADAALTVSVGSISSTTANGISAKGTVSVSSGTVTGQTNGISLADGSLTISGGTVQGQTNDGISATGAVSITNGTIIGQTNGVKLESGTLTVGNGTITGTTGKGVLASAGTVTIAKGTITGADAGVYLGSGITSATLRGGAYNGTNPIISEILKLSAILAEQYTYYSDADGTQPIEYGDDDKQFVSLSKVYVAPKKHIHDGQAYTNWTSETIPTTTSAETGKGCGTGYYFLSEDITKNQSAFFIEKNANVTICLNGHTLDLGGKLIAVGAGATLTICDYDGSGTIKGTNNEGVVKAMGDGATINLKSGTIDHGTGSNNGAITTSAQWKVKIIISGGTIKTDKVGLMFNNTSGAYGLKAESNISITGGSIIAGTKAIDYSNQLNTLEISGGTITGNTNALYVGNSDYVKVNGGTFVSIGNKPIVCTTGTVKGLLGSSDLEFCLNQRGTRKATYADDATQITGVQTLYVVQYQAGTPGVENQKVSLKLITYDKATNGNKENDATVNLGPNGTIPATAKVGEKTVQIEYFTIPTEGDEKYTPYDSLYQYSSVDENLIVAYAVDTETLYEGAANVTVAHLERVFFVNIDDAYTPGCSVSNATASSNLQKYDENYGLSLNSAFTSMADAGQAIKKLYDNSTYDQMKNDTYAVILLGKSNKKYNLSDFEVNLSVENGATQTNGAFTYKMHHQSPNIYMSASWMGTKYNNYLVFKATSNAAGYSETYYKGETPYYAQQNRAMLYNNLIINEISVATSEGDLFVNGYNFTATENVTSSTDTDGSPRQGGIPKGHPKVTVNGGTVANDDGQDKNHAGSFRTPEGPQANITILSGRWGRVSGGSRSLASSSALETQVTVGGNADIGTLAAAAVEGSFTGNSYLHIKDNAYVVYVVGSTVSWPLPNNEKNTRKGNTRIVIDGSPTIQELYGGTLGRYSTNTFQEGNTSIIVNGGSIEKLWGGSAAGQTFGDISIEINNGSVGELYGAGSSKSPMIEDVRDSSTAKTYNNNVDNYGDKTDNGYDILNYNAEKQGITNLGNTYGTVNVEITGGTVGTVYGGGMGFDYMNDENYGKNHTMVDKFYNIAQVCNCASHDNCSACDDTDDLIKGLNQDCPTCTSGDAAVKIKISGGTITGDVFAGGKGIDTSNRIAKICSGTKLTITGGTIQGDVYGGSEYAALNGDTSVDVTGGTFAHDLYGGGKNGVVAGNTSVNIGGTAAIAEDVYGAGEEGDVYGNVTVSIAGQSTVRNIFGGGKYANVGTYVDNVYVSEGNISVYLNGSDGAQFTTVISGGQCGQSGSIKTTVENFGADQKTGSIYCCGRGEDGKADADINGDIYITLKNVTLEGIDDENHPKRVYIGGTENGRVKNDIWLTEIDSSVVYYNKYGVITETDTEGTTTDFTMKIISGGVEENGLLATFPGADMVESNNSDGIFSLPNGSYRFTVDTSTQITRAVISWDTPSLTISYNTSAYVWDPDNTKYVKQSKNAQSESQPQANGSGGNVNIRIFNLSTHQIFYTIQHVDLNSFELSHTLQNIESPAEIAASNYDDTTTTASKVEKTDTISITKVGNVAQNATSVEVTRYTVTLTLPGANAGGSE